MRFVLFECIWYRLVALQNSVQNRPKWCKSSCHEVVSEFSAMNAPDPPHWTLNLCLIAFQTILVLLGPFGCVTTLSAKRAKLVQKFVPRSRVGTFLKNAPDPPHWTLNSCFGVFSTLWMLGMVWLPYKTQCKRGRNGSKVRVAKSRHNFSQRTQPIHPVET